MGNLLKVLGKATYTAFYAREFIRHFDNTPLHSRQFFDDIDIDDGLNEDTDDDGFSNSMTGLKFRLASWPSTAIDPLDGRGCPPVATSDPVPASRADVAATATIAQGTLTATVTNAGPDTVRGVTLDVTGGGVSFTGVKTTQGMVTTSPSGARINIGDPAKSAKVTVTAGLRPSGDYSVTVTASSASSDPARPTTW